MIRSPIVTGFLMLIMTPTTLAETTKERAASHLQQASAAREQVEAAERNLHESLEALFLRLNLAIDAIQPEDFVGERVAIAELRKIVPRMHSEALAIIEAHKAYQTAAEQYAAELDRALPTVYQAAKVFKQFADSEPYHDLQAQYVLVAETLEAIAAKYQQKKEQVRPSIAAVSSNLAYTQRTALFLERLEKFLVVMPSDSPDTERFMKSLARYVQSFETLREQLKAFHRATIDRSSPGSQPPKTTSPSERPRYAQEIPKVHDAADFATRRKTVTDANGPAVEQRLQGTFSEEDQFGAKSALNPFSEEGLKPFRGNLSGNWTGGNGSDVLRFDQRGSNITISLFRSPVMHRVTGKLRIQNSRLLIDQLHFHLRSGQKLNLGGYGWEILSDNLILCTCPGYSKEASGEYQALGSPVSYTLRRL